MRSSMLLASISAAVLGAGPLGGCGDDGGGGGGECQAPVDENRDNASCGDQTRITGELVDWDTESSFCGVGFAVLQVPEDGAMDETAPNGRFDLCGPADATTLLEVTLPTGTSPCAVPTSSYSTPTTFYVTDEVIRAGGFISGRTMTDARRTSFYADVIGAPFDAAKGHLLVHVDGDATGVAIAGAHGPAAALNAGTWALGSTGTEVFFPNIEVGGGVDILSVDTGCAAGTGGIVLAPGTITNVTIKPF